MPSESVSPALPHAGLLRRFAAMVYDSLLLLAILFIATALILPFTHGNAVPANNPWLTSYLFFVCFFFNAWFWTHGGQTLGMRAWKIRVQRKDGRAITLWQALLRFLVAVPSLLLAGAGYWWMLVDRDHMTWHDRYSESVVVKI